MSIVWTELEFQDPQGFWRFEQGGWMLEAEAKKRSTEPTVARKRGTSLRRAYRWRIYWED